MDNIYTRKLSVSERLFLGANEVYSPFCNQFVGEGHGDFDYATLCHAVEVASAVNPGSRLVLKGCLSGCRWVDSGITPPVRVVDGTNWDGRSSDNAPFLMTDLPYTGPTCEVVYIKGNPTRIAFRSSHGVMDGVGMFYWLADVFMVLRGDKPMGSPSTITDYELIESLSDRKAKIEHIQTIAPTGKPGKKAKGTTWKRITIEGKYSNVFGRVAMALAKSAWTYQDGRFRVGVPVNLRTRISGPNSTGNLSNMVYFEVTKNSTPESVMNDMRQQLENKNDCINIIRDFNMDMAPIWLIGLVVRIVSRSVIRSGLFGIPVVISNMGRFDPSWFCGGGFTLDTGFGIPPNGDIAPCFVGMGGVGSKLEITVSVPNILSDNGRMDKLVEDIKNVFK